VEQVAYCAMANRPAGKTLEPPYEIELVFSMPEGQRPKYAWPTKDGDGDKLERAILDGLVRGKLILDDRHVIACTWRKAFGTPSVRVLIH
jgi:Holliday junction resolvase RusA-like endonuclease